MIRLNRSGFTMTEAMMTLAILSIVTMALMSASTTLFKVEGETGKILDSNRVMTSLMESIRADPSLFQANFSPPSVEDDTLLQKSQLKLGYRKGYFGPIEDCPQCKVRMGFVIRPLDGQPGLFRVTIRSITTEDNGTDEVKELYGITTSN